MSFSVALRSGPVRFAEKEDDGGAEDGARGGLELRSRPVRFVEDEEAASSAELAIDAGGRALAACRNAE